MACQQAFKVLIEILDNSKEKINMSSEVKNPATQVSSLATSMSVSGAGAGHSEPICTGTPTPAIFFGRAFANTQDARMYEEFMNVDKEM